MRALYFTNIVTKYMDMFLDGTLKMNGQQFAGVAWRINPMAGWHEWTGSRQGHRGMPHQTLRLPQRCVITKKQADRQSFGLNR